ncbi:MULTISPECIES: HIT family protein [Burkholderiaceae]|uniref:HIT family protein n=1 Tax=Burkholderiaceae TaxID=119060 RepID=UPI00095D69B3|nr:MULTISPECIES: HIT family protein [Burkholderiaceae]MCF2134915.1 HIT family protein [Mycetohabitans sp. B3]MCG1019428.1 HIT family protein [Mycetohabitans sp. B4]SIT72145.1 Diadenosine tetraphosphate (Ap4A) hydrolase [Burkholderia sp. b13]
MNAGTPAGSAEVASRDAASCVFCAQEGGTVWWRDAWLRVIEADEPDYPGFCRLVWNAHVTEFSDLSAEEREHLIRALAALERALRATLNPDKINIASLGNMVAHQHWHVIPRFADDPHFPAPVWAARCREPSARQHAARVAAAAGLGAAVRDALQREFG